ncbi:MAG: WD40 repeat domain-containing protein [Planctomycetota bacterium]|nr:WD40 repeat domain-containing protein [Planctomycetota bacterium]
MFDVTCQSRFRVTQTPLGFATAMAGNTLTRLLAILAVIVSVLLVPSVELSAQEFVEFKGHQEVVYDARFLPDGKSIVTASFDRTLKLWDVASQKILRTMDGHTGIVLTVDVSPNGQLIASGSSDRSIRLWDVPQSDPVSTDKVHDNGITAMSASRDGTAIATADEKGQVRIWRTAPAPADSSEVDLQKPTFEVNVGTSVSRLAWRNDNQQLAAACSDGTVRIINPTDGSLVGQFGAHDGEISGLVFSPNNQQILTCGVDGFVRRWPTAVSIAVTFEGVGKSARAVTLHPNGSQIAVTGDDGSVKILGRADGAVVHALEGHSGAVSDVVFNRAGTQLATGCADQIARVFDVASGKLLHETPAAQSPITAVALSADGKEVIVGTERGDVLAYTLATPVAQRSLANYGQAVRGLAASTDGSSILASGDDRKLHSLDPKTGEQRGVVDFDTELTAVALSANNAAIAVGLAKGGVVTLDAKTLAQTASLTGHTGLVSGLSFNATGTQLVSSSADGSTRLWDLATGSLAQHFSGHEGAVVDVGFQNDNKSIITAGVDGRVRVETVGLQLAHRADDGAVHDLALSSNGSQYATAGADGTIKLWNASNGTPLRSFVGFEGPATCVSLSADNQQVAAGGSDKTIRTWNVSNSTSYFRLETPAEILRIAYSPDSTRLVASLGDNTIQCFDPTPLNPQLAEPPSRDASQTLAGHTSKIADIAWSPDNRTIRTSGLDMTLREWSIASPKEKATLSGHSLDVYSVVFSPDGQTLASASADKTVRLWNLADNKAIKTLVTLPAAVYALAFSADGAQLAVAGADNSVRLLSVSDGREIRQFTGPQHPVYSVSFSPDNQRLAAGGMGVGSERSVYVWSIDSSEPAAVLSGHNDDIYRTQFNATGFCQSGIPGRCGSGTSTAASRSSKSLWASSATLAHCRPMVRSCL